MGAVQLLARQGPAKARLGEGSIKGNGLRARLLRLLELALGVGGAEQIAVLMPGHDEAFIDDDDVD